MSSTPRRSRGRGGLGKYLRARGRRGTGRPAEFGKSFVLEDEQNSDEGDEGEEASEEGKDEGNKYTKRKLGTNVYRYEEPKVDPYAEPEPEPEVDLSSFLEKQRLTDQDHISYDDQEGTDGVDHTLSNLPSAVPHVPNTRKNKTQTIEWDASMDQLKREKEAAEAVWDLKSRFRRNQPRLAASSSKMSSQRTLAKVEDSRHIYTPPDPDSDPQIPDAKAIDKAGMEDFLDNLLS